MDIALAVEFERAWMQALSPDARNTGTRKLCYLLLKVDYGSQEEVRGSFGDTTRALATLEFAVEKKFTLGRNVLGVRGSDNADLGEMIREKLVPLRSRLVIPVEERHVGDLPVAGLQET